VRFGLKILFFAWRGQALSKIASGRLQKELTEWQVGPPAGFSYRVSDNLQR
jgi:ubiquitin-conjugating enzyme E2 W